MVLTPSRFKDFSTEDLTYSGLPLAELELELVKIMPNLVARKIWSRFPVRLNLKPKRSDQLEMRRCD